MKKKLIKRKKAQFGEQVNSLNAPVEDNYNWMNFNMDGSPVLPGIDPIMQMPISNTGKVNPQGRKIPMRTNPDGSITFSREEGTGNYTQNPYVKNFNLLTSGVTGVANMIQNNRLKEEEQRKLLQAQGPQFMENMDAEGMTMPPIYTKYGGDLSSAKAKEMLKDGKANGKKLTAKQKRYFGMIAGGKKQTGGSVARRMQPSEMTEWNQFLDFVKEKGFEGSSELNAKNKNLGASLFKEFKTANPGISINYDIVPLVQNEMQLLKDNVQSFARRRNNPDADNLLSGISQVDGWFGSKTSQYRFPKGVEMTYNNGSLTSQKDLGLLKADGFTTAGKTKAIPAGVKIEKLQDGYYYEDPNSAGDMVRVKDLQFGGDPSRGMDVEAEEGEIVQEGSGDIVKIDDTAGRHEEGGVKLKNVNRVLEDTADKRKDKASKLLRLKPDEVKELFGFKPKSSVSHSKAFELAVEHYDKQRDKIKKQNELINDMTEMDKEAATSARLNFKTMENLPRQEEIYDALFMHQEAVKNIHNINDDGSIAKCGTGHKKFKVAQAGASAGSIRPPRGKDSANWYFDEATQRWFRNGTTPAATQQPVQQPGQSRSSGITPYEGGRTTQGAVTPMGNKNAFNFTGGLDAFKKAWSPVLNVDNFNTAADVQSATYDYLVKNQPDVAASIWETQGLTQKGRDMMNPKSSEYDQTFATAAGQIFDETGKIRPGTKLTPDQLKAISPAYADNMLGVRVVTPDQFIEPGVDDPGTPGTPGRQPLDASVTVNPKFTKQPDNRFFEPTYWDDLATPAMSLVDSLNRDPELMNPVEFEQVQYHLLDPTAAMNANQADYNAVIDQFEGDGANIANLQAQKYTANAQVQAQYDNQNNIIKNKQVDYNANVRDRQSVANAQTRGSYHSKVQASRENQRQQRLKAVEDITRVIQMKRRQNRSGNLLLKLSPAFNQYGEYNGYQYNPTLPAELGLETEVLPIIGKPASKKSTKTTTSWKLGDKIIKTEVKE